MSKVQFRNIDLNLLIPLKALLHERNVTRAAERIHLSQSAMSRALDRLRSELGDELLVRVGRNYELTPRGSELLEELAQVMPRLARLWAGETFSPAQSEGHIRLAMNDYASSVVLAPLAEICGRLAPGITLEGIPWHERFHEESGLVTTHLILSPLSVPSTFRVEPLFQDVFVCVLGRKLKHRKASLTMKDYLSFRHISVETQPNQQSLIDRPLGEAGFQRRLAVHLPYLLAAIRMLETTDLALTMPARIAGPVAELHDLVSLKTPKEIPPIRYSMVWHPRFESDPLHMWLRETVRQIFHPAPSCQHLASNPFRKVDQQLVQRPDNNHHPKNPPTLQTESQPIVETESTTYKESLGTVVYTRSFPIRKPLTKSAAEAVTPRSGAFPFYSQGE